MKADDGALRAPHRRAVTVPSARCGPRAGAGSAAAAGPAGCSCCPPSSMYALVRAAAAGPDGPVLALRWNGIGPSDVGRPRQLRDGPHRPRPRRDHRSTPSSSIVFFSFIPVVLGLLVASLIRRVATGRARARPRGRCSSCRRSSRSSRRASCGAGCCPRPASSTRSSTAIGLGGITRAWLGDFDLALPAVGLIGAWVLLGLCTVLLLTGMSKIDPAAVRVGAHRRRERVAGVPLHHGAEPALRDRRLHHGHGHRRARGVRHRLHLDRRRARHRHDRARASRSTASRSSGARSAWRPRSRSSSIVLVLIVVLPIQRLTREEPA